MICHSPHRRYSECGLVSINEGNSQINYWSLLKDLRFPPPDNPPLPPTSQPAAGGRE